MIRSPRIRLRLCWVALCPVILLGCGGPSISETDVARGVYAPQDLGRFVEDTRDQMHRVLEPEYVIGVGDELDVVFLYHSNLSTLGLRVRRDGRISLPYVGDQMAAGLTPMTLDTLLTRQFTEILREPNLSVIVKNAAPQTAFVLGEVKSPGGVQFEDRLSLVQAIANAGGMEASAARGNVVLIRRMGVDRIVGVEIDVKAILEGRAMRNDVRLRNYDIVYVPKRPINSVAEFVDLASTIVLTPITVVLRGYSIPVAQANYEFLRAREE